MALEDQKLRLFVKHHGSLGTGRETILRKFLKDQTPEPYRVSTGFVAIMAKGGITSDQCDVLVYDPRIHQPFYQIEEFVVVPPTCCSLAIEVRSSMDLSAEGGLKQVKKVNKSMAKAHFPTQVFGFGFDGPAFGTFIKGLGKAGKKRLGEMPECIAVQNKDYVCVRVYSGTGPTDRRHFYLAFDFGALGDAAVGYATAFFMYCYSQRIRHHDWLKPDLVSVYARDWGIPGPEQWVIRADGTVKKGFDLDKGVA